VRSPSLLSRPWFHLSLILGFSLLIFLGDALHLFEPQELGFTDLRFRLRPPRLPHEDIVVVVIDDESVSRIGHWPWPRSYHAALLKALSSYRPRLVLYDVLFTEASTDSEADRLFTYALKNAGNVILPFFFRSESPWIAFFPLGPFREAARYTGYVNIFSDPDARIRKIQLSIQPEGKPYHHTSVVAVLSQFQGEGEAKEWLKRIPVDRKNSFWVNYPGDFSLFRRVSFADLVEHRGVSEEDLQRLFEGKVVIVGSTATGGGDFRPTPFSPAYPGVGIQASAVDTLLSGNYLRRFQGPVSLVLVLCAALLVNLLTRKNTPAIAFLAALLLAAFYLVWNFLIFDRLGWILPVFPVLVVILGTYVLVLLLQFIQVQFEGELLARELSLAAQIQENFLPRKMPEMEGLEVGFQCQFARVVGGDLYDWVPLGKNRIGLCVGDVSGKGIPAAIYMARAISEFRSLVKDFDSPAALLDALNRRLVSEDGQRVFVTLLYLILDLDSRTLFHSNAGHEPLFYYRVRKKEAGWVREGGAPPLGLFAGIPYAEQKIPVEPGDFFVVITDGVRELRNPRGEEFGPKGMEKVFSKGPLTASAPDMVKLIFQGMGGHSRGVPAHDDQTILCLKIGPRGPAA